MTPGGWVAKACIYNVGNGATVLANDTIVYANDTRAYTIETCPYASISAFQPAGSGQHQVQASSLDIRVGLNK